jgi:hypothetical protein
MSQDVPYRPASATKSGMHDGCQNVGSDFGHRAKQKSR